MIGYTFIAPQVLGFILFVIGPLIGVFFFSLNDFSLMSNRIQFIGLDNYRTIFFSDPLFIKTMKNTGILMAGFIPLSVVLATVFGVVLANSFRGNTIFRGILFAPVVTSAVAWGIVWKFLLQENGGPVNEVLTILGLGSVNWLGEPGPAMASVIVTRAIKNMGINMIIIMAAVMNVPYQLYEVAKLDGASTFRQFRSITLPMISPSILMVTITTSIGILKVFDTIMTMTGGGPYHSTMVIVYYLYYQAFQFFEIGYASAVAVVLFVITLVLTSLQWSFRKLVHYEA
jgi:multiple sugar transport system permease protein